MPTSLYPLRFEPIFKSMLWGGQRLPGFLHRPQPQTDPIGEAWVLSDVDGSPSRVVNGPLAGQTLRELLASDPARILGKSRPVNGRFPLLLKFIDAQQELSVQVHPNDVQAARAIPGANGKTEAWVVLEANSERSQIYSGFKPGITAGIFRDALLQGNAPHTLHSFTPSPGDCVFLQAGTVHAIGADILLFEVQQTSDITYRLYDWNRLDARTGKPRELHVNLGLECCDFERGPCDPVKPITVPNDLCHTEQLVSCQYFTLTRHTSNSRFPVGAPGECRVIVCVAGQGELEASGESYPFVTGDVVLLPAELGECFCLPIGDISMLECGIPA